MTTASCSSTPGFPVSATRCSARCGSSASASTTCARILLTHAHVDHFGSAIWFAKTHGTPVYLPRRRGRPRPARVPRAGVAGRTVAKSLAAALPEVVDGDRAQGRADPRGHPDAARPHRGGRGGAAGHPDGDPHARATPAGTVRTSSTACWSAATRWSPGTRSRHGADRSCCPACSTTIRTAACAASLRWACWTPRCCCRDTARCGAVRSATPSSKPRTRLGERLVAEQEDRGQAQAAGDDDRRHQDHAGRVRRRRARLPRRARIAPARPRSRGMPARTAAHRRVPIAADEHAQADADRRTSATAARSTTQPRRIQLPIRTAAASL